MNNRTDTTYLIRSLALMIGAIIANIALGYLVRDVLQWPLYLDSLGTVLVGALLGPLAGAAIGAVSNVIWGGLLGDPSVLPYTITAAFIGWAAGYAAWRGAFRRFGTALLAGLLTGVGAALISAPITAYVLGDVTGGGGDYLTSYLTAAGANLLQAATIQGFISDPLDKTLTFACAWLIWRVLQPYFRPLSQRGAQELDTLQGYSVAVAASLIASLLSFVFLPAFERGIFTVFYIAVLVSAWRGGLGPALLTMAVGAVANILFLVSPYHNLGITAQDWLRVGIFVVVSLAIAAIANQLERSKRALQARRACGPSPTASTRRWPWSPLTGAWQPSTGALATCSAYPPSVWSASAWRPGGRAYALRPGLRGGRGALPGVCCRQRRRRAGLLPSHGAEVAAVPGTASLLHARAQR